MSEKEVQILQTIECSSMVSTWNEYLCLEVRDGRAVLSHRRYDALGELSDYAVETDDGDEEYRIPEVIDGKPVVGTEDDFIVGGELTPDPSDSEPELELGGAAPDRVRAWLTERGFDLKPSIDDTRAGTVLDGQALDDPDDVEDEEIEADSADEQGLSDIASVTHVRIRLKRWMDFPASGENDYAAEVIKKDDKFYYKARGVTVPVTHDEVGQVISNPFLYYFSTALKLHKRIDQANESGTEGDASIANARISNRDK